MERIFSLTFSPQYVPVCIAGDETTMITAEPAVVVPIEADEDFDNESFLFNEENSETGHDSRGAESKMGESKMGDSKMDYSMSGRISQRGVYNRRTRARPQHGQMMRRASVTTKVRPTGASVTSHNRAWDETSFSERENDLIPRPMSPPGKLRQRAHPPRTITSGSNHDSGSVASHKVPIKGTKGSFA